MNHWPETRNSLLVRLVDAEDRAAWDDFVALYQPLIYRYSRRRGLQDADARDVTQAVLCAVARSVAHWDQNPQRGRFRSWLATVTRNTVIDLLRKNRQPGSGRTSIQRMLAEIPQPPTLAAPLADPGSTQDHDRFEKGDRDGVDCSVPDHLEGEWEEVYEHQLLRHAVRIVRSDFSERVWEAFWQTTARGRSVAEVARQYELSAGAVYTARSRVMKRIAECVDRIRSLESHHLGTVDAPKTGPSGTEHPHD